MAHPGEICKALDEERKNANNNDGLYSRFLMSMPQPEFLDADTCVTPSPELPSLSKLLYAIDKINADKKTYVYCPEGLNEAMKFYNEQQEFLRTNHSADTYISGVVGKLKGHCHRLARVIQALHDGCKILKKADEMKPGSLDESFIENIKKVLSTESVDSEINLESTRRAITLAKYFLQHKKFLSGYNVSGVVDVPTTSSVLAKKILLQPGQNVTCNIITRNSRYTADK